MFYDNAQSTQSMLNGFYGCQSMNYAQQIRETCSNAVLSVQQQRLEDIRESYKDFLKSCFNCKHRHGTWCNKFQRHSAIASAPTALMGTGDCLGYRYWEPIKSVDESLKDCCCETKNQQKPKNDSTKTCGTCKNWDIGSPTLCGKFRTSNLAYNCSFGGHPYWEPKIDIGIKYSDTKTSIATELYQCKTNEENLEVARKHGLAIDLTKQENQAEKDLQTKIKIEELKRRIVQLEYQNLQTNVFKPYCSSEKSEETHDSEDEEQVKEALNNALSSGLNALAGKSNQSEERFTLYDLYDLVFPDDPIKAHFDAERKRINEEYEKQKAIYEQMEIKPVNHVEIVQKQTGKPKINQEVLQTWVEFEKYVSITFAAVYIFWVFVGIMLAFPVSVENGTRFLVDVTRIHSALFLAASSVSLAVAVFASRSK